MNYIRALLLAEPAISISLIGAVLGLLIAFGVHIDNGQVDAIKNLVGEVIVFAGTVLGVRQSVYAPDTHAAEMAGLANADGKG